LNVNSCRNGAAAKNPTRTPVYHCCIEQWISGEAAPGFQFWADALFITNHRDQIAWAAAAHHSDQLRQ
jgi:hypothetical protein